MEVPKDLLSSLYKHGQIFETDYCRFAEEEGLIIALVPGVWGATTCLFNPVSGAIGILGRASFVDAERMRSRRYKKHQHNFINASRNIRGVSMIQGDWINPVEDIEKIAKIQDTTFAFLRKIGKVNIPRESYESLCELKRIYPDAPFDIETMLQ